MPLPMKITYKDAEKGYYIHNGVLKSKHKVFGDGISAQETVDRSTKVCVNKKQHSKDRVYFVLSFKRDLQANEIVFRTVDGAWEVYKAGSRPPEIRGRKIYGKRIKPDWFNGTPIAGVSWRPHAGKWYVAHNTKCLGLFEDYNEAVRVRINALGLKFPPGVTPENMDLSPAKQVLVKYYETSPVPSKFKDYIFFNKFNQAFDVRVKGFKVQEKLDLYQAMQYVQEKILCNLVTK